MADSKISALSAVATPDGADEFGVNQAGTSKKVTLKQIRQSLPTKPSVISVGAEFSSTGVPTATLPGTHATNDILVLVLQSSNDAAVTPPAGYQRLGPQNGIGVAATAGTVKLSIFWKRDGGSESAPTIPDTGDHTYGVMFAVRGCPTSGDPFHLGRQNFKFTTSTTGTSGKSVVATANSLVVAIFGHGIDNAAAQGSGLANADLANVTEQFDDGTTDGTGGGIYIASGEKSSPGTVGAFTVTWANTTVDVSTTIVFLPEDAPAYPRPREVQIFIGSPPDLDDTWQKPAGAVAVRVGLCDGGGSGSSGNTTTTAAGGGGGGGGGYDDAVYDALALADTISVHAGKGGAATTALNQAGNPGVLSEFDKGGAGPLTSNNRIAGTAATAAASADGGDGGCGSGYGKISPTTTGTRISLESTTDGCAYGRIGGRGGSGTTAPTAGSPAVEGGGGGESGADTDGVVTSNSNGYSLRGGGGGGGGRTNANVSGAGHGGGAQAPAAVQGAAGTDSTRLPYGGSGGCAGGSTTVTGGAGGFPGGGGGGGGGIAGGFGGRGGHGCVIVVTDF